MFRQLAPRGSERGLRIWFGLAAAALHCRGSAKRRRLNLRATMRKTPNHSPSFAPPFFRSFLRSTRRLAPDFLLPFGRFRLLPATGVAVAVGSVVTAQSTAPPWAPSVFLSARVTAVPLWALSVPLQVSSVVAAQSTVPPWALPVPLCSRS